MPDLAHILDFLERDGVLELDDETDADGPRDWPQVDDDEEVREVDFTRLFPGIQPARDGLDHELYGDDWEPTVEDLEWILDGDDAAGISGEETDPGGVAPPGWDVWAWYEPIHFFGPDFGIYIRESALLECARLIRHQLPGPIPSGQSGHLLAKALLRAAFATLYLHEQYHHKTESVALRLHVVQRKPVYPAYFWPVYKGTSGTDGQIEEGLANADSWFRIKTAPYSTWISPSILRATVTYLDRSFSAAPPGYRNAQHLTSRDAFRAEQYRLFAQVQEGRTKPRRPAVADFAIATEINRGLFKITQRIYTIVRRGAASSLPVHPALAPLQTRRLDRHLRASGWIVLKGAGKGSHAKYRHESGRMIILPRAKDVSPGVLRTTAETLGLRGPQDLESACR